MPTALENAIDSLSDPAVSLPDALRRLLVVSRRIAADELTAWLRSELNGYSPDRPTPEYRSGAHLPIRLYFDGPMRSSSVLTVTTTDLPVQLSRFVDGVGFREPVAELDALAQGDRDAHMSMPARWIGLYRRLADEEKVPSLAMCVLNEASAVMPRTHLRGILDGIRSTALDLALSLEDISPEVGSTGGPTVNDEPQLAQQVHIHLTQLFAGDLTITLGDNATVAAGKQATAIRVAAGDIDGLLLAAASYLSEESLASLTEALRADGNRPAEATHTFLDRVKSGAILLAGGVTTNAAYDGLLAAMHQAFPGAVS